MIFFFKKTKTKTDATSQGLLKEWQYRVAEWCADNFKNWLLWEGWRNPDLRAFADFCGVNTHTVASLKPLASHH